MVTLHDVFDRVQELESSISCQDASSSEIKMLESGEIRIHSEDYKLIPEAQNNLAQIIECPTVFFDSAPVDLRANIVNRLLPVSIDRISAMIQNSSEIIGFVDNSLISLLSTEVLETALDAIPESIKTRLDELEVRNFSLTGTSLELNVTTPHATVEVRKGDVVAAGISIYHSPSGSFATQISTHLFRLACLNGLLIRVCRDEKRLRIRRLDNTQFTKQEMLDNLREISELAWNELDFKLNALAKLSENRVEPLAILENLVRRFNLNKKLWIALREALYADELGFDENQLSVINALSRVATHFPELSTMQRRRLMVATGVLSQMEVHRCPVCLSIINGKISA